MVTHLLMLHFRVVTLLCEAEAKVNIGDLLGNTPLHYACSSGHIHIVKYLMQNGSNPMSRLVWTYMLFCMSQNFNPVVSIQHPYNIP